MPKAKKATETKKKAATAKGAKAAKKSGTAAKKAKPSSGTAGNKPHTTHTAPTRGKKSGKPATASEAEKTRAQGGNKGKLSAAAETKAAASVNEKAPANKASSKKVRTATFVADPKEKKPADAAKAPAKKTVEKKPAGSQFPVANTQNGADLDKLRADVKEAVQEIKDAEKQARDLREEADATVRYTKIRFHQVLQPYKDACKKAGVECEFKAKRGPKTERVRFLVEKVDEGIKVTIKDRLETAEVLDSKALKKSIMKVAADYCEKHIGPKSEIGFKHAGLYNRIRKALGKMK